MGDSTKLKVGRWYRFTREAIAVSVDACAPPCVKLENPDGSTTGYLNSVDYDVVDLGPTFESGYYIDRLNRMWKRTSDGDWVNKAFNSSRTKPSFPIRKVTVSEEEIDE